MHSEQKNNQEMHGYASRLGSLVDERIKGLMELRNKARTYEAHIKEHEFCERRLMEGFGTT